MDKYSNFLSRLGALPPWSETNESVILAPFRYLASNPGKDIRSQLIEAFNVWFDVPAPKVTIIMRLVNILHTASLLIDDIEDGSQLRRGQLVAHKIYGIPQTINTATYLSALAYQEIFALRDTYPRASGTGGKELGLDVILTDELLALHRGQGLDLLWRDTLQCPTEEEYISMVNDKTGGLLRLGIKLLMACSPRTVDEDYVPLVNLIGIYFQIRDDLMNLESSVYTKNKGFAEDLTEGKFSFPIVHSIHADTSNQQVLDVLQKRPTTPTLKNRTIAYLRTDTKSIAYTHSVLETLEIQTRDELRRLGGNAKLEAIMDLLTVRRAAE